MNFAYGYVHLIYYLFFVLTTPIYLFISYITGTVSIYFSIFDKEREEDFVHYHIIFILLALLNVALGFHLYDVTFLNSKPFFLLDYIMPIIFTFLDV